MVHTFNEVVKAGGYLYIWGQPVLHTDALSQKKKKMSLKNVVKTINANKFCEKIQKPKKVMEARNGV